MFRAQLRPALLAFLVLTLLTGGVYPALISLVGGVVFPVQASGDLITRDGRVLGSRLIGQAFSQPGHFWSRPSATPGFAYNAAASSGSNLGPSSPVLRNRMQQDAAALRRGDGATGDAIPVDLLTASASGLDPDITPAAADYQVPRIVRATGLAADTLRALIGRHITGRQFGILGEPRVNVLSLNLGLDSLRRNARKGRSLTAGPRIP